MATATVRTIVRGFPFTHTLVFQNEVGAAPRMRAFTDAEVILGSFVRATDPGAGEIGTIGTADGTLAVLDPYTLRMAVPAALTALLPLSGVRLSFARRDGDTWSAVPVIFDRWPVRAGQRVPS